MIDNNNHNLKISKNFIDNKIKDVDEQTLNDFVVEVAQSESFRNYIKELLNEQEEEEKQYPCLTCDKLHDVEASYCADCVSSHLDD